MRERILTIGGMGSGKTYTWMRLAIYFKDAHFYIIDTEAGAERSLLEFPEIKNVTILTAFDWPEYRQAQKYITEKAKKGDWMVVDAIDKAWTAVQRWFIGQIFDQEMGEYFLEARRRLKKDAKSLFTGRDAALKGWLDWPVINRNYDDFVFPLIYRSPAHLYMVSGAQAVSEEDEKEIRELYGPYGLRPGGQKSLAYQPDTVLLLAYTKEGYLTTTIKDRGGRKYMDRQRMVNFPIQYGKIAGW